VSSPGASNGSAEGAIASPLSDIKQESYVDMDKSQMIAVIQFLKREKLMVRSDYMDIIDCKSRLNNF